MNNQKTIKKYVKTALIIISVIVGAVLFFNYIFPLFLPFFIAWGISFLIQPLVKFIHKKMGISEKIAAAAILILLFSLLISGVFLLVDRIVYELTVISGNLSTNVDIIPAYVNKFFAWLEAILVRIPLLSDSEMIPKISEGIDSMAHTALNSITSFLTSNLPLFIAAVVKTLPATLIFTVILVVSTFYICIDYNKINVFIIKQIPEKVHGVLFNIKDTFITAIYKYLKAYILILFITFCELLAGFLIIGINYAITFAAVIAVIDIFPILGSGLILVPWGIILLIQKNYFQGFGLLILFAVIEIIRQFIEPRIIGKSIGLYPVVTLVAVYAGFKIMGFGGIFLFPICILILKNLNDDGKIKLWKNPVKSGKNEKNGIAAKK